MSVYKYARISTQSNLYQIMLGKTLASAYILQPILTLLKTQQFDTYSCKHFMKRVHLQVKTVTWTTFLYLSFAVRTCRAPLGTFSPFGYTLFRQLRFAVLPLLTDRRFVQFGGNFTVHTSIPTEQNSKVEFLGRSFSTWNPHQVPSRVDEARSCQQWRGQHGFSCLPGSGKVASFSYTGEL